jgi:hypothetical protein
MQNLCAIAGDFLGLIVVQCTQQTRGRHGARIGAEHAGDIGPNFQPRGAEFGRQIRSGSIRSAPAQQHGFAGIVGRDESLGNDDLIERLPSCLQLCIGREIAGRREKIRFQRRARTRIRAQHLARIRPGRFDSLGIQE